MLEIDSQIYMFHTFHLKEIYFADYPYDVDGCATVTFNFCRNKIDLPGFSRQEETTLVIDLTQDLDALWKNMKKKSCQYQVNRARREGVVIKRNQNFEEFHQIYRSFWQEKMHAYTRIRPEHIKYGTLFTAEIDDETVAGQLYLEDASYIRWLIGGSKRLEVSEDKAALIGCANRLMHWEAIQYAKEKGIKEFDFGGIYSGDDKNDPRYSINIYKQSFGGTLVTYYNYNKVYSKAYKLLLNPYRLVKKVARLPNTIPVQFSKAFRQERRIK